VNRPTFSAIAFWHWPLCIPSICKSAFTSTQKGLQWRLRHVSGSPIKPGRYQGPFYILQFPASNFDSSLCACLLYVKDILQVPERDSKRRLSHISGSPIRHVKYQWIAVCFQPALFGIGLCAYLLYVKAHLQVPKRAQNEDLGMLVGHPSGLETPTIISSFAIFNQDMWHKPLHMSYVNRHLQAPKRVRMKT